MSDSYSGVLVSVPLALEAHAGRRSRAGVQTFDSGTRPFESRAEWQDPKTCERKWIGYYATRAACTAPIVIYDRSGIWGRIVHEDGFVGSGGDGRYCACRGNFLQRGGQVPRRENLADSIRGFCPSCVDRDRWVNYPWRAYIPRAVLGTAPDNEDG